MDVTYLYFFPFKGADTLPTHTQNGLLVAIRMVYLVLLCVELFHYADETKYSMRTRQAKFAGERTSGYRETRLTVPDTSDEFCEWSG